jgi:hypothetical protein
VQLKQKIQSLFDFSIPVWTVLLVGVCAYTAGSFLSSPPQDSNGKFVTIARNMVIFQAVQTRRGASESQLKAEVVEPIRLFIQNYQDQGYAVIDTSIDGEGNMAVLALPKGSIDVTHEISQILSPKRPS